MVEADKSDDWWEAADATLDVSPFALADERILSPALWPRLEGAAH